MASKIEESESPPSQSQRADPLQSQSAAKLYKLYVFFWHAYSSVMYSLYEIEVPKHPPPPPDKDTQADELENPKKLSPVLQLKTGQYPDGMSCVSLGTKLYFFGGEFNMDNQYIDKDVKKNFEADVFPRQLLILDLSEVGASGDELHKLLVDGEQMRSGKARPHAFVAEEKIYVIGSTIESSISHRSKLKGIKNLESFKFFEVYDPKVGKWHDLEDPPIGNVKTRWVRHAIVRRKAFLVAWQGGKKRLYCFDLVESRWIDASIPFYPENFSGRTEFVEDTLYGCYHNTIAAIAPIAPVEKKKIEEKKEKVKAEEGEKMEEKKVEAEKVKAKETVEAEEEEEDANEFGQGWLLKNLHLHVLSEEMGMDAIFKVPPQLQSSSSLIHLGNRYFCYVKSGMPPNSDNDSDDVIKDDKKRFISIVIFQALGKKYEKDGTGLLQAQYLYSAHYEINTRVSNEGFINGCFFPGSDFFPSNFCPPLVESLAPSQDISSARVAWDILAKNNEPKLSRSEDASSAWDSEEVEELSNSRVKSGEGDKKGNIDDGVGIYYMDLHKALQIGDWNAAKEFLNCHPHAISAKITFRDKTALHVAAEAGHVHIVEELVKQMSEENLEIKDYIGYTALAQATYNGNYRMAECMLGKNENLISIATDDGDIPVVTALYNGHLKLARFLYLLTPLEILMAKDGAMGASVVCEAIFNKALDIALDLVKRCPRLVVAQDRFGDSPFYALACMPDYFRSGNRLVFWKRWIYSGIYIQSGGPINHICLNIQKPVRNRSRSNGKEIIGLGIYSLSQLVSKLRTLLGIEHLYEMKLAHFLSRELLSQMKDQILILNTQQIATAKVEEAILRAVKEGIFEFVFEMVKADPSNLWICDEKSCSIFSVAVQYRHAKIYSLIYGLDMKNALAHSIDSFYSNNLLHMAGMLAPSTSLNHIAGAALQMQRELQWFKEVESIVPPMVHAHLNREGLTPRELFTKNHKDMRKDGEQWMKDTATSCTVVGALIVTIMFAAVFTVPGGNDQNKGFQIFLNKKLFMVFIVSDALSLFSSSTSVMMFLGILTSRYAEEDFLESLPRKMIIGLSTLFFSIATMMTAFSAALFLMLHEQSWIFKPVICFICLASVPITLFGLMQFPLLVVMAISTYGPSIFNRKMKRWF